MSSEVDSGEPDVLGAELALRAAAFSVYLDKMYTLSSGTIDRYRAAASSVQTAAAAIGVLYTGALALVFGENVGGLPARGLLTPAFIALAMVSSMFYISFLEPKVKWRSTTTRPAALDGEGAKANAYDQLAAYRMQIHRVISRRLWALHSAVITLGFAIVFAPAPFASASASAAQQPDWPDLPPGGASDASLQLFEAELAEVASLRAAARAAPSDFFTVFDWWCFVAAFGALLVAIAVAVASFTRQKSVQRDLDEWEDKRGLS